MFTFIAFVNLKSHNNVQYVRNPRYLHAICKGEPLIVTQVLVFSFLDRVCVCVCVCVRVCVCFHTSPEF
jgi:hypothetical protein